MARKTIDERINANQMKMKKLAEEEKALKKKKAAEDRKKRTRRLIELGAIIESVLGRPITDEDKERFLIFLQKQEQRGCYFTRAMNTQDGTKEKNES